jgi:hypothetical protein
VTRKIILHVLLPLCCGLLIYLLFRTNTWLTNLFHINEPLLNPGNSFFTRILVYNVPDFCWAYSFTSALLLWNRQGKHYKKLPLLIFFVLILSEGLQLLFNKRFHFDLFDLVAIIAAFILSYLLIEKNEK